MHSVASPRDSSGCSDCDALEDLKTVALVEVPVVVLGSFDILRLARRDKPTKVYGIVEAVLTTPGLLINSALTYDALIENKEKFSPGEKAITIAFLSMSVFTVTHGIYWGIKGKRTRARPAREAAPLGLTPMPITDGKSVGAGLGVVGRF